MKNLHKKIGAMALAGMLALGGVASSGLSANADSFSGDREFSSININDFIEKKEFKIFRKVLSEQKMDDEINKILESKGLNSQLRKRLLYLKKSKSKDVKSKVDIEKLSKSGKQLHRIKVGKWYYLLRIDKVSFYAANRESKHKFYSLDNQRNYDIMEYYSKFGKHRFDIIMVADSNDSPGMSVFNAKIRSSSFSKDIKDKLLEGPEVFFKNVELIKSKLESGINVFEKIGYSRIRVDNLEYIIHVKQK